MPDSINRPTSSTLPQNDDEDGTIQIPNQQVHPAIANAPHPEQQEMFPVNVNGNIEMLTREQATVLLQKDMAGDEKLREAHAIQKDAASAIALQDDIKAYRENGDTDAFRRAGAVMGIPGDQVEEIIKESLGTDGLDGDDEDVVAAFQTETQTVERTKPVSYDQLTPDLQRAIRLVERERIEKFVNKALDNDEVVSYNMGRLSDKGQETIRKLVDEKVRGRLDDIGGDFGDGSQILPEIVNDVRELFTEALGSPERTHGAMSLGAAPGGGDAQIYPSKLPDHVSSTEGDAFTQNVIETIQFHHNQAERGKR